MTWRHGPAMHGNQDWLSFYWKSPQHAPDEKPQHDLFIQLIKLKNTLRWLMNEAPITYVGDISFD